MARFEVGPQKDRPAGSAVLAEFLNPFGRLPVAHPGVVQAGSGQHRWVHLLGDVVDRRIASLAGAGIDLVIIKVIDRGGFCDRIIKINSGLLWCQ